MNTQNKIRIPKQKRSIEKKTLIKKAAYTLMCTNGYHNITTNQIAKEANLSIGSLYEYYPNKEAILSEILTEYFEDFLNHEDDITKIIKTGMKSTDKHQWILLLLHQQVEKHKESIAFNRELHSLYYSVPIVASFCSDQKALLRNIILTTLSEIQNQLKVSDLEAAAWMFMDILDSAIDRAAFNPPAFDIERYLVTAADAICDYLFL